MKLKSLCSVRRTQKGRKEEIFLGLQRRENVKEDTLELFHYHELFRIINIKIGNAPGEGWEMKIIPITDYRVNGLRDCTLLDLNCVTSLSGSNFESYNNRPVKHQSSTTNVHGVLDLCQ